MIRTDNYVLAVDLGTSGPKTALVSVHGDVVDSEFQDTPVILFPDGGAEQDPQGWWDAIRSTARKVIGRNRVPPEDIVAVSVTTQWSGTVPVDRDGRHLMNGIIWMDGRAADQIRRFGSPDIHALSGKPADITRIRANHIHGVLFNQILVVLTKINLLTGVNRRAGGLSDVAVDIGVHERAVIAGDHILHPKQMERLERLCEAKCVVVEVAGSGIHRQQGIWIRQADQVIVNDIPGLCKPPGGKLIEHLSFKRHGSQHPVEG